MCGIGCQVKLRPLYVVWYGWVAGQLEGQYRTADLCNFFRLLFHYQ